MEEFDVDPAHRAPELHRRSGALQRLARPALPGVTGLVSGLWLWPWGGWPLALAGFALIAWTCSTILRRIRQRPVWRRGWRAGLAAWMILWTGLGMAESRRFSPRSAVVSPTSDWQEPRLFRAGVGEAFFDLPRAPLAGWGHPPRRTGWPAFMSLGVLGRSSLRLMGPPDPGEPPRRALFRRPERRGEELGARALVLVPEEAGGHVPPPLGIVRLDLIEGSAELSDAVLERVGDLGFTAATLLVSATHTHSGPGGYLREPLAEVAGSGHYDPAILDALVETAAAALRQAVASAAPARLAFAEARDRGADGNALLARNRRADPARIDDRVMALRLEHRDDGRPLALLLNYSVHPVFRRPAHLAFDRDLAGALEDALSARLPGHPPVLFVNGAPGDVNFLPAPGGEITALAGRFADAVEEDLMTGQAGSRLRITAAQARRDLGSPFTWAATGDSRAFLDDVVPAALGNDIPSALAAVLSLPFNVPLWSLGFTELRLGFSWRGAAGLVLELDHALPRREFVFSTVILETAAEGHHERRSILAYPAEANQAVGRRWRRAAADAGLPPSLLFGLTNGAMSYIADAEEYVSGSYEAQGTLFGPDTAILVEEALLAAASPLGTTQREDP